MDLCVNHGYTLRECRASLSDEERKKERKKERRKEKIQFLPLRGSCCRRSFSKVFICIPIVRVRKLESVCGMSC